MNRIERALWRIFVIVVLLIGLPLVLLAAIIALLVEIAAGIASGVIEWWGDLRSEATPVFVSAWRSFRKGSRLDGTERL